MANLFESPKDKALGVFTLIMINLIAVGSLRSLSLTAVYGFSLVFFYLAAALFFFIPSILITMELATTWPTTGGPYIWIREAFGSHWGFFAVWLQWIYNVVWYPTIFSLIAATLAYLIDPHLAENKFYLLSTMLLMFWGVTFINCRGIKTSSLISTVCALLGTVLPMLVMIGLSIAWLLCGKPSQINFSWEHFFPGNNHVGNLAFLSALVFGLMGMEMSGVHAGDVRNPQRDYPRALFISAGVILVTLILGSLAIAMVVPLANLNLMSGVIDAFAIFFNTFHLPFLIPLMAALIVIGSLGCASAWIIGTARGISVASEENNLPLFLQRKNQCNMPTGILISQGIIFTALCTLFIYLPSINATFWFLSNLTAQLALMFYLLLFAAAIRLRYKHAAIDRPSKIPGGKLGIYLVAGVGMLSCIIIFSLGFLPPAQVAAGNIFSYEMLLIGGIFLFCILPMLLVKSK